jgi:hypothetical protein
MEKARTNLEPLSILKCSWSKKGGHRGYGTISAVFWWGQIISYLPDLSGGLVIEHRHAVIMRYLSYTFDTIGRLSEDKIYLFGRGQLITTLTAFADGVASLHLALRGHRLPVSERCGAQLSVGEWQLWIIKRLNLALIDIARRLIVDHSVLCVKVNIAIHQAENLINNYTRVNCF